MKGTYHFSRDSDEKQSGCSPVHGRQLGLFIQDLKRRGRARKTVQGYERALQLFFHHVGKKKPRRITRDDFLRFQTFLAHGHRPRGKPLAVSTQAKYLAGIRSFLEYGKKEGILFQNPVAGLPLPKVVRGKPRILLRIEDVKKMIDLAPSPRDRAVVYFLATTGLRASECCGLNLSDVDMERREVLVRKAKGDTFRLVFITPGCRSVLVDYLSYQDRLVRQDSAPFFLNDSGGRLVPDSLRFIVERVRKKAGIPNPVRPHAFRHFFCTILLENGANVRVVAELAGHVKLSTTTIYTHLSDPFLQDVYRRTHPRGTT